MNIRAVTYLAIILAGFFAGFIVPFAELAGFGFTTLFLALFLPYFGWKGIAKIKLAIYLFVLMVNIPSWQTMAQEGLNMGQFANNWINSLPHARNEPSVVVPDFTSFSQPLGIVFWVGMFCMLYVMQLFMVWSAHRMLRKTGFFRIFSF